MTGEPRATGDPRPLADEGAQGQDVFGLGEREHDALLAWVGENLTLVRRSASGQRVLYWSLGIGFAVGLAAHVGGFLLKNLATTEPLLLVVDLLYALGWALWTGVVVVMFVQVYPETKKTSVQAGPRCLRGGGRPSGPSRKWSRPELRPGLAGIDIRDCGRYPRSGPTGR